MSPQLREATPSLSASLGSAETLCDDDVPPIPMDTHKEGELHKNVAIFTQGISGSEKSYILYCSGMYMSSGHRETQECAHCLSGSLHSAVCAGPAGGLSLGEDDLDYATAKEAHVDVGAPVESQGRTYRPMSIISFSSDCGSVGALSTGSQLLNILGAAEEASLEHYHMPTGLATSSGVSEVVAMAEVSTVTQNSVS